jgi:hypothetical protein
VFCSCRRDFGARESAATLRCIGNSRIARKSSSLNDTLWRREWDSDSRHPASKDARVQQSPSPDPPPHRDRPFQPLRSETCAQASRPHRSERVSTAAGRAVDLLEREELRAHFEKKPLPAPAKLVVNAVQFSFAQVATSVLDGHQTHRRADRRQGASQGGDSRVWLLELTEIAAWPATIGRRAISERERTL